MQPEFLFDFASPNAYLAHKVIPQIEARTGAKFTYTPVLLGGVFKLTGNQAPMIAFGNIRNKMDYEMLETRRFIARHRLNAFRMNPHFPVNTLLLMRIAAGAEIDGGLAPYMEVAYRHMWELGSNMSDPEVVRAALNEGGLDAELLMARAQAQDAKDRLMANTSDAVERGAFGIPTFVVGTEIFFGKNTLREVEEEIVAQKRLHP
ncbi:MAG: putative 2-hydroxychromene-2-carboxylate isomerase [Alphaproteobacteria bacterium]|nr:MAG: putative 2-hydroxychromene-2-carboxylate isomerase [Caulobacteraceae bacterium]TPW04509.1 MAG: putative 2-hydroxychromene-2-carboxylate isomerase [Alphaproteobacteria bacterium]